MYKNIFPTVLFIFFGFFYPSKSFSQVLCDLSAVEDFTSQSDRALAWCGLDSALRHQERDRRILSFGLPVLKRFIALNLPHYSRHEKLADQALKRVLSLNLEEIERINGSGTIDLYIKHQLLNKVQDALRDGRFTPQQRMLGAMHVIRSLEKMLDQTSTEEVRLNTAQIRNVSDSSDVFEKLLAAMDQAEGEKLESELKNKINAALLKIRQNSRLVSKYRKEVLQLRDKIEALEENQRGGQDVQAELKATRMALQEAKARAPYEDAHFAIQQLYSGAKIATTILALSDPQAARRADILTSSGLRIADSIISIEEFAETGAKATIAPYATIAVAAFQILEVLGESGVAIEQVLLDHIIALSDQIKELRIEVNTRFDRVEAILGHQHVEVMNAFSSLSSNLRQVDWNTRETLALTEMISRDVLRLDRKLDEFWISDRQLNFAELKDNCVGFSDIWVGSMRAEELRDCLIDLRNFAVHQSRSPVFTGLGLSETSRDFAIQFDERNLEYSIGAFAGQLKYDRVANIPNPIVWAVAADAVQQLLEKNSNHWRSISPRVFDKMIESGEEIKRFTSDLNNRKNYLNKYFSEYRLALSNLFGQIKQRRSSEVRRLQIVPLIARYESFLAILNHQLTSIDNLRSLTRDPNFVKDPVRTAIKKDIEYLSGQIKFLRSSDPSEVELNDVLLLANTCEDNTSFYKFSLLLRSADIERAVDPVVRKLAHLGIGELKACYKTVSNAVANGGHTRDFPVGSEWYYGGHKLHKITLKISYSHSEKTWQLFQQETKIRPRQSISDYSPSWVRSSHWEDHTMGEAEIYYGWVFSGLSSDRREDHSFRRALISGRDVHCPTGSRANAPTACPVDDNFWKSIKRSEDRCGSLNYEYQEICDIFDSQITKMNSDIGNILAKEILSHQMKNYFDSLDYLAKSLRAFGYFGYNTEFRNNVEFREKFSSPGGLFNGDEIREELLLRVRFDESWDSLLKLYLHQIEEFQKDFTENSANWRSDYALVSLRLSKINELSSRMSKH